ncbi:MAG: C-terminal binding protein [Spirochaetales bacterium]|nr:C-terminal binding protein [Spirochaetales bacterium]
MNKVVFTGQRLFMKFPKLEYFESRMSEADAELVCVRDESPEALAEAARGAAAVVVIARPIDRQIVESMERCRLILTLSVGYDCVDVAAATARGIPVCNTPAYCTDEVANHAMTLVLAVARKLHLILPKTRQGAWDYKFTRPIFNFRDKCLGIVGLGRVGRAVVPKARGFGMRVAAYDPYLDDDLFALLGVERCYELPDLLSQADYLTIHAPLTGETLHMLDERALALMKPHAVLVNTARGPIVDEQALCRALESGGTAGAGIAGAGIDVLDREPPAADSPLLRLENALVTPHVAWYSEESHEADMIQGMDELVGVLTGHRPRFIVNPEIFGA